MIGVRFVLRIKLRFSESSYTLPANFVEDISDDNLERSTLQNWKSYIIVAKEWEDNHTSFIVAVLKRAYNNVAYDSILNSIQKALSSTWTLHYNNMMYKLSPTFNKDIIYVETFAHSTSTIKTLETIEDGDSLKSLERNRHLFMLRRDFEYLQQDMRIHGNALDITKLSFCSLIELESFEYTGNANHITLTSSNMTLSQGEFLTVIGQDGEIRPRICVEELYPPENAGKENDCPCGILVLIAMNAVCTLLW